MNRLAVLTAAVALSGVAASGAVAAPLTTGEILNQFNLVTFGDVSGTSHVDGRSLIGGNLTSSWMVFNMKSGAPPSTYAALTVGGSIAGAGVHLNSGGNAVVGGNVSFLNMNGHGTAQVGGTGTVQQGTTIYGPVTIPSFEATLKDSSAALTLLAGAAPTVVNGNKALFGAAPVDGTTVYSLDLNFFSTVNEVELALNGADTVIINVSGKSATLADNFLGGSYAAAGKVLWNFFEAEYLTFDRQFIGSVLAPYAHVTVTNNNIEGALVARSASVGGELHLRPFTGSLPAAAPTPDPVAVPAPAALPVFLAGLAGLAMVWRRRKAA